MRALALLALLAGASAVELSHYNFKESVQGEKSAFVKFLAPWQATPQCHPLSPPCPGWAGQLGAGEREQPPCPCFTRSLAPSAG